MVTITEDYCSKEIYRLLIEKGFDGEVHTTFDKEGYTQPSITLQMAMKWLREVHNLFIEIQCYGCEADEKAHFEYSYVISEYVKFNTCICTTFGLEERNAKSRFPSYEGVCEAAIRYCLEHLI